MFDVSIDEEVAELTTTHGTLDDLAGTIDFACKNMRDQLTKLDNLIVIKLGAMVSIL